jgi:hypothetical protein
MGKPYHSKFEIQYSGFDIEQERIHLFFCEHDHYFIAILSVWALHRAIPTHEFAKTMLLSMLFFQLRIIYLFLSTFAISKKLFCTFVDFNFKPIN